MTVENDVAKAMELYENTCKELHVYDSCLALGNIFLTNKSKALVIVHYFFGMIRIKIKDPGSL